MILQSLMTALSTGLGCGTCCGSGVSAFLFSYLTTHTGSLKHSFRAFLSFYLGKILAVAGVCVACSLLGRQILSEDGNIGSINIHVIVNMFMIAMGVWFIIQWIRERLHPGCASCHHCTAKPGATKSDATKSGNSKWSRAMAKLLALGEPQVAALAMEGSGMHVEDSAVVYGSSVPANEEASTGKTTGVSYPALMALGAGYGISPCAPLLLMAGYAATLAPAAAFLTGCIFAAASAFVPMLLIMFLTGILSSKLYKEIPQYIGIFRLISYILLIVIFAVTL